VGGLACDHSGSVRTACQLGLMLGALGRWVALNGASGDSQLIGLGHTARACSFDGGAVLWVMGLGLGLWWILVLVTAMGQCGARSGSLLRWSGIYWIAAPARDAESGTNPPQNSYWMANCGRTLVGMSAN